MPSSGWLRCIVVALCGLQVVDYFCVDLCVDHEEVYQRFINSSPMHRNLFVLGKAVGIVSDLLIMIFAILNWSGLLEWAVMMHVAACAYNVAELDMKAAQTVNNGEPMEWSCRVYIAIIAAVNCLRLATLYYVWQYWCLVG